MTEPSSVLTQAIAADGLCTKPGAVTSSNDPWFPVTEVENDLVERAREACAGCPVMEQCKELTLRQEVELTKQATLDGEPYESFGILAGLTPRERRTLVLARLGITAVRPSAQAA
jgi:hypothetical protein